MSTSPLAVFDGLASAGWLVLIDSNGNPIQTLADVVAPGVWQSVEFDNNGRMRFGVAVVMLTPGGTRVPVCTIDPPIPVSAGVKARVHFNVPGHEAEFNATRDRLIAAALAAGASLSWSSP